MGVLCRYLAGTEERAPECREGRVRIPDPDRWPGFVAPPSHAAGYTVLELVLVVTLISILSAIAYPRVQAGVDQYAVISAEQALHSLVARSRGHAVGSGAMAYLVLDPDAAEVRIEDRSATDTTVVDRIDFADAFEVALSASAGSDPAVWQLCMSFRGFAEMACNDPAGDWTIELTRRGRSRALTITPLGEVILP